MRCGNVFRSEIFYIIENLDFHDVHKIKWFESELIGLCLQNKHVRPAMSVSI